MTSESNERGHPVTIYDDGMFVALTMAVIVYNTYFALYVIGILLVS